MASLVPLRLAQRYPNESALPQTLSTAGQASEELSPAHVRAATAGAQIDPALRQQETLRRIHENSRIHAATEQPVTTRRRLSEVFLGDSLLHNAVEASPFVKKLRANQASKEEYMQYLVNLRFGLEHLEHFLVQLSLHPLLDAFQFEPLYRLKALNRDINESGVRPCDPSKLVVDHHQRHFRKLHDERPYLLVAHAAMRYLAILFGGQYRAERLKTMWKGAPVHLYAFSEDPGALREKFLEQLNAFGDRLSDKEYRDFLEEIKIAWEFAGDILGNDIRHLSRAKL